MILISTLDQNNANFFRKIIASSRVGRNLRTNGIHNTFCTWVGIYKEGKEVAVIDRVGGNPNVRAPTSHVRIVFHRAATQLLEIRLQTPQNNRHYDNVCNN